MPLKKRSLSVPVLLACFALAHGPLSAQADGMPSALVIDSRHLGSPRSDSVIRGIDSVFFEKGERSVLHVEYMDSERFPGEKARADFIRSLAIETSGKPYKAVIATDDEALRLALGLRPSLFPDADIVFCCVGGNPDDMIGAESRVTGICANWDPDGCLAAIAAMQPGIKEIVIVCDGTESSAPPLRALDKAVPSFEWRFRFRKTASRDARGIAEELSALKPEAAVFLVGFRFDGDGRVVDSSEAGALFASASSVPVYTMDDAMFSGGVMGGSMLSRDSQGMTAAKAASALLSGSRIEDIPIMRKPEPTLRFDYAALDRFRIPRENWPPGSLIVNQPSTPSSALYRGPVPVLFGALIALLVLSVGLASYIISRRGAETERARMAVILEATTDLVAITSVDDRIRYMNGSGRQLLGWSGISRKGIQDAFPPKAFKRYLEEIKPVVDRDGRWTGETSVRSGDGRTIPVSLVAMLHSGRNLRKRYYSTIMRDISSRIEAEEALRESEENLRITMDAIGEAVIATDASGSITRMNPAAEAMTRWSAQEALGSPLSEVFRLSDEEGGQLPERDGDNEFGFHWMCRRDGVKRAVADSSSPIRTKSGDVVGSVLVFRDVTQELEFQENLQQSQRMEAVGRLSGGIAHDFNNALTAILGSAQLIGMSLPIGTEGHELAEDIACAAMRASELTRQLLYFSRKVPIKMEPFRLNPVIEDIARLLSRSIDKLIEVKTELRAERDLVNGDQVFLHSAILSLGIHASDAMPNGGTITIRTGSDPLSRRMQRSLGLDGENGDYIRISVADSGPGTKRDMIDRLFEPLPGQRPEGTGTDMGLAAVYGCVHSHRGRIKEKSEPGQGSEFIIYLPLLENAAPLSSVEAAPTSGAIQPGRGHILLIDDEEPVRKTTGALLRAAGYTVSQAEDGLSGLKLLRERKDDIDVVILDLIMPNMSGREAFYLLKELKPDVKVLLYSGNAEHQDTQDLLRDGAWGFLNKPFRLEELASKVQDAFASAGKDQGPSPR